MARKKIGLLTGGGDCPGLNPVIRAVVRTALTKNYDVVGIRNGWRGLVQKDALGLNLQNVSGIIHRGGTILGTSRTNPFKKPSDLKNLLRHFKSLGLYALIATGGEDTLGVAAKLFREHQLKVIGVPKTIDNDLSGTDYTFGFDTAVNTAMEAIDRLHTTAESHHRIMVAEVMGRHAGWIAIESGLAGGADIILIPEVPINIDEVCKIIKKRNARGKDFSIVVVAEGAKFEDGREVAQEGKDEFGHARLGGVGYVLAKRIEEKLGFETRVTVLGHIQRGGSPSARDRMLGTRFGVKAVELVDQGRFGHMAALRGNEMTSVLIEEAVGKLKTVDEEIYNMAKIFFG